MARRDGMDQVELLELDHGPSETPVDAVDRARGAVREAAGGALGWIRRHLVLSIVVIAAVVGAIAAPVVVSARADRARLASLAALPGVLAPMDSAPRVAWTSPPISGLSVAAIDTQAWVRDEVLVVRESTGGPAQSHMLRALDLRSGEEVWTTALSAAPQLGEVESVAVADPTACVASPRAVVCLVPESWRIAPEHPDEEDVGMLVEPTAVRLRAYDVRTGGQVLDLPVAQRSSVVELDGDVVLAQTPESGTDPATLTRLDPTTGDEVWSVDVPRPTAAGGVPRPTAAGGSADAQVQLYGEVLEVSWLGSVHQFAGDGSPAGVLDADVSWHQRGGRWAYDMGTPGLTDLDSGRHVDLEGGVVPWIAADDGSAPGVLVVQGEGVLRGVGGVSGGRLWEVQQAVRGALPAIVVADERLAVLVDGLLTVRDLRTGEGAWVFESTGLLGESMVTDGEHLIVLVAGEHRSVVALDLADGHRAWSVRVPTTFTSLAVVDHRLFGVSSDGLTALVDDL
ncbi:PQQ-binding-like beta-propeller repeat protein [uncultured Cellulomonas sp.]|uniref:outer membrane protein assembly factor BamB family protein n=1 Tax=uncultured Cellulomonas sp. TaxID=189682 RepID=UPI0028F09D0E|nr:PQQ-binding-like beta-propeller repeat protein [uncultured Cellulomonas sp.]